MFNRTESLRTASKRALHGGLGFLLGYAVNLLIAILTWGAAWIVDLDPFLFWYQSASLSSRSLVGLGGLLIGLGVIPLLRARPRPVLVGYVAFLLLAAIPHLYQVVRAAIPQQ